jgi:hypothetical protein
MMNRIIVHLMPEESAALSAMIAQDTRTPRDQLRYLLVNEAKRRGLLPDPPTKNEGNAEVIQTAGATLFQS